MARVTVEDCIEKVDNRFELVILSAYRSREIANGAPPHVERNNDKNPVISLREIAEEEVSVDSLRYGVVDKLQRYTKSDEAIEENNIGDDLSDDIDHDITMDPQYRQKMQNLQKEDASLLQMRHVPMFEDVDFENPTD